MIGQLSSIVKRRNSSKRKHQVASLEPCALRVDGGGSLYVLRTNFQVPEDAIRRSDVLSHLATAVDETVHLPISEAVFLRWLSAVTSNRKGFLGLDADDFAVVLTVRLCACDDCTPLAQPSKFISALARQSGTCQDYKQLTI